MASYCATGRPDLDCSRVSPCGMGTVARAGRDQGRNSLELPVPILHRMSEMTRPIVVAGGGLAGAAAACLLSRAGRQTLLIERETQATDKICGEFISAEAQENYRSLGLNLAALG